MGHRRRHHHKKKHKGQHRSQEEKLNLSEADKTLLGVIATLNCPIRPFTSILEKDAAKEHISNMRGILNGKARRVADCVLDKSCGEQNKVRNYADKLIFWANSLYEIPKHTT
jgi:hypothetical protein